MRDIIVKFLQIGAAVLAIIEFIFGALWTDIAGASNATGTAITTGTTTITSTPTTTTP